LSSDEDLAVQRKTMSLPRKFGKKYNEFKTKTKQFLSSNDDKSNSSYMSLSPKSLDDRVPVYPHSFDLVQNNPNYFLRDSASNVQIVSYGAGNRNSRSFERNLVPVPSSQLESFSSGNNLSTSKGNHRYSSEYGSFRDRDLLRKRLVGVDKQPKEKTKQKVISPSVLDSGTLDLSNYSSSSAESFEQNQRMFKSLSTNDLRFNDDPGIGYDDDGTNPLVNTNTAYESSLSCSNNTFDSRYLQHITNHNDFSPIHHSISSGSSLTSSLLEPDIQSRNGGYVLSQTDDGFELGKKTKPKPPPRSTSLKNLLQKEDSERRKYGRTVDTPTNHNRRHEQEWYSHYFDERKMYKSKSLGNLKSRENDQSSNRISGDSKPPPMWYAKYFDVRKQYAHQRPKSSMELKSKSPHSTHYENIKPVPLNRTLFISRNDPLRYSVNQSTNKMTDRRSLLEINSGQNKVPDWYLRQAGNSPRSSRNSSIVECSGYYFDSNQRDDVARPYYDYDTTQGILSLLLE